MKKKKDKSKVIETNGNPINECVFPIDLDSIEGIKIKIKENEENLEKLKDDTRYTHPDYAYNMRMLAAGSGVHSFEEYTYKVLKDKQKELKEETKELKNKLKEKYIETMTKSMSLEEIEVLYKMKCD